jgi:hypothetical protein
MFNIQEKHAISHRLVMARCAPQSRPSLFPLALARSLDRSPRANSRRGGFTGARAFVTPRINPRRLYPS